MFNDVYKEARRNYRSEEEFEAKRREIENQIKSTSDNEIYYAVDKTFENYDEKIAQEGVLYKFGSPRNIDFAEYYKDILSIDYKNRQSFWDADYMVAYYHMQYADTLIKKSKISQALEELKTAQKWGTIDYRMLNNVGIYYLRLEKPELAKSAFLQATTINSDYYIGYTNLGYVYEVMGDKKNAEENYIKALTINPRYLSGIYKLAALYEATGELEKALYGYRLALQLDPTNAELAQYVKELESKNINP